MRKLMLVVVMMVAAALGTMAGAQTWQDDDGSFSHNLTGCERLQNGRVRCTISVTSLKADAPETYFRFKDTTFVAPDGTQYGIRGGQLANNQFVQWGGYDQGVSGNLFKGLPVKYIVEIDYPTQYNTFARFTYENQVFSNVTIKSQGASAPTPRPAATAPVTNVNLSNYNAALTGCKTSGSTITCTGAVLTPVK